MKQIDISDDSHIFIKTLAVKKSFKMSDAVDELVETYELSTTIKNVSPDGSKLSGNFKKVKKWVFQKDFYLIMK